ncbi:MAG: hypothetical protein ACETWG_04335 [Candidatus Neomarinimicrobiota bacterium]
MAAVMTYGHQVREEAFSLYCHGMSFEEIVQWLQESFGVQPDKSTIAIWARAHGWSARRAKVLQRTEKLADESRALETARLLGDLRDLREQILAASGRLEFKSAEGPVRSLATLQRVIDGLTQPQEGAIGKSDLEMVVDTILEILYQDEVLGPVLRKREWAILAQIEAQLAESGESL